MNTRLQILTAFFLAAMIPVSIIVVINVMGMLFPAHPVMRGGVQVDSVPSFETFIGGFCTTCLSIGTFICFLVDCSMYNDKGHSYLFPRKEEKKTPTPGGWAE